MYQGLIPIPEIQIPEISIPKISFLHFGQNTDEVFVPALEESIAEAAKGASDALSSDNGSSSSAAEAVPVLTGWQTDEGGRYYIGEDGERASGWLTDEDSRTYLLDENGYPKTGWQEPDIGNVYLDEDGVLTKGLKEIDGNWYYFGYDGVNLTGWQDVGVNTYYFSKDTGAALTGWQEINGEDCFFDETGVYDPTKKKAVQTDGPVVALTFDDGPGEYTDDILDLLEQYNVKATFFMIGSQIYDYPSAVVREHDIGMEQGNHSWDHKTLTHLTDEQIYDEVYSTVAVLEELTGDGPTLFRPPGGGYNDSVLANSCGLPAILWSIDTLDWSTKDAQATYNSVMNNVKDGDIILMHEIYSASYEAAKMLIPALLEEGYSLVTVSELAEIKGVTLESGHVYGSF